VARDRFERVDRVLRDACGEEFIGAVARVEAGGRVVFERAYGLTRADALARPVYADTRFDLASLTKLFVATLALRLVADGRLTLDRSVVAQMPEWQDRPHAVITARMLLDHTSGMNSGADYRTIAGENVERFALERDLVAEPGERVIYSDLGFIALGVLVERITGHNLDASTRTTFASPSLGFRPRATSRAAIPAKEEDDWRGRVQGYVHDEKAYLMGGVAGHAGLFGTARDVAVLTAAYLGPLRGRPSPLLAEELVREAVREQAYDPVLRRGLGWALKTSDENSCGRLMDPSSFGHTGFVGTCVWADPVRDVQAVLLTNSVYFGRNDTRDTRAAFYEAAVDAVESGP
jgi:CubicO group peptidase (beta-lactamase class C family)